MRTGQALWRSLLFPSIVLFFSGACTRSGETPAVEAFPRDASLRATFAAQEPAFERLREMLMRDRHLWRIGFDLAYVDGPVGTPPRAPNRSELPEPRWDEYRRLFRTLGIERGATRESEEEGAEAIYLPTKIAPRGAVDSEEKGFVIYGPRPPDPLFTSLDSPPPPAYYAIAIYAPLKDHWYLYRRYNE